MTAAMRCELSIETLIKNKKIKILCMAINTHTRDEKFYTLCLVAKIRTKETQFNN